MAARVWIRYVSGCMGYRMRVTALEDNRYYGSVQTEDGKVYTASFQADSPAGFGANAALQEQIGHQLRLEGKRGKDFEK